MTTRPSKAAQRATESLRKAGYIKPYSDATTFAEVARIIDLEMRSDAVSRLVKAANAALELVREAQEAYGVGDEDEHAADRLREALSLFTTVED